MYKSSLLLAFIILLAITDAPAQLSWPTITQTARPWTRWWWHGSAVNKKDLTWNLEQYKKAGLGGVEITPIYGVQGYEKQFVNFLSPAWMDLLQHTLKEAKRSGLGVDLANGTGWPFGGPWITTDDASKTIYLDTFTLSGGGEYLFEPVSHRDTALVRTANNRSVNINGIFYPWYLNRDLQSMALDQVHFPTELPLVSLMAYQDQNKIDLTKKVTRNATLLWDAPPPGNWKFYALFEGLHGKMVERAAPGGEGYAIDHFSSSAANNYFKKFDEAFKGYDLSYLRCFFNDSYEVDDARGQASWTSLLFDEFKTRKGYDLRDYLPALFGHDDPVTNSRVIYDYRSVIDELILNNFTKQWKKWAVSKRKKLRNQSHGSPANTLDLYSVVDIPEAEGNSILRFKFATSAANVTGKKLVSSESATWLNEHFLSSWGDVKQACDLYFLGGVNHIFYHGTAYSPKDAPWPGWLFYAAVHFQPTNPQWKDFSVLNDYIARTQSFLQNSRPDNDVLVYFPISDRYAQPGNALLQHFDGIERNFEGTDFAHISEWMQANGYSFDYFSDRQLQSFKIQGKKIVAGGNRYQTILLPANKLIPEQSLKKLLELCTAGATILFYKELPSDIPGLYKLEERKRVFQQMMNQLSFGDNPEINMGKGRLMKSANLSELLKRAGIRHETMMENNLQFTRRRNNDTTLYFIVNKNDSAFDGWITLNGQYKTVLLFDPMNKKMGAATTKSSPEGTVTRIQLHPGESIIVKSFTAAFNTTKYAYEETAGSPIPLNENWTIEFLEGGPSLPEKITGARPGSWTEFDGSDVKNFSGTAKYSITFTVPAGNRSNLLLDLGEVHETAEVFVNGKRIGGLIGPVFTCIIPSTALASVNKLEIVIASSMANRISYMDRNKLPWKIFYNTNMPAWKRENSVNGLFDASNWKPVQSGLCGPVTIKILNFGF